MESKDMIKSGIALIAVAAMAVAVWWLAGENAPDSTINEDSALTLDLESLEAIDPELLTWSEVRRIETGFESLTAIAVVNDVLYASGGGIVASFDTTQPKSRIDIGEEVLCLDVDDDGTLYLGLENRIEVRNGEGELEAQWEAPSSKSWFTAIAAAESGVYVADAGTRLIYRYDREGSLVNRIGEPDPAEDFPGFSIPSPYFDLAIGYEGYPWVVDPGKHLVMNYTPEGRVRSSWGATGTEVEAFCGCCNPTHLAIFPNGFFATAEKGIVRVKIYAPNGQLDSVVAGPDDFSTGIVGLDLAVDSRGRLYITDPEAKEIRVYARKEST